MSFWMMIIFTTFHRYTSYINSILNVLFVVNMYVYIIITSYDIHTPHTPVFKYKHRYHMLNNSINQIDNMAS